MNSEISVAIATYNGERYIEEQLESIAAQTLLPAMIVVSDDGSSDRTLDVVESFRARSPVELLVRQQGAREGVIVNFMRAFELCRTEYIAYCDQDDVWHETKIARYAEVLSARRAALVFHRSCITDEKLVPTGHSHPSNVKGGVYAFPHFPTFLWGHGHQMLFSKEVLRTLSSIQACESPALVELSKNFDVALLVAAGMVGDIVFVPEDLMKFRRHDSSVSPAGKDIPRGLRRPQGRSRAEMIDAAFGLLQELCEQIRLGRLMPGDARSTAYLRQAEQLLRVHASRSTLYRAPSRRERLVALGKLMQSRAYGDVHANRLHPKQLLLDLYQSLA